MKIHILILLLTLLTSCTENSSEPFKTQVNEISKSINKYLEAYPVLDSGHGGNQAFNQWDLEWQGIIEDIDNEESPKKFDSRKIKNEIVSVIKKELDKQELEYQIHSGENDNFTIKWSEGIIKGKVIPSHFNTTIFFCISLKSKPEQKSGEK